MLFRSAAPAELVVQGVDEDAGGAAEARCTHEGHERHREHDPRVMELPGPLSRRHATRVVRWSKKSPVNPETARKTWRTAEPIHGFIYFLPEAADAYASLGDIGPRTGYFASRAAAMGEVPTDVVISTFYNFNPQLVRESMEIGRAHV